MTVPLQEYHPERIAIIKPSALGDIVHALPVLTALRQRFPAAHLAWIVNRAYEPLLCGHPDLDETIPYDRKAAQRGLGSMMLYNLRFLSELRKRHFDLVIDLQGLFRAAVMSLASGARRRVGLSSAREGATHFYTDVVPVADFFAIHAVDRYWLVAEALGIKDNTMRFTVPLSPAAVQWANDQLTAFPRPWTLLGVGSRWQTKRWPVDHFAALTRQAQRQFGGTAVFIGGGDETPLAQQTAARLTGPTLDLTGRTSLPQLAGVLSIADLVIANDTGPLHLAVALGRPVVAPYTCTRNLLTGPYGRSRSVVETSVWCAGSLQKQCDRMECMSELTPARLWPLVEEELSRWQSSSRCA